MRAWLNDPRAYHVFRQWLLSPYRTHGDGYNQIEHFRAWALLLSPRFFDITQPWPEASLAACCNCLVMEIPK